MSWKQNLFPTGGSRRARARYRPLSRRLRASIASGRSTPSAGDRQPACRAGGISVHGKRRTGVEVIQKYTTSMAGRWKTRPRASRTRPCSTSSTSRTTGSPASPSAMPASQRRYIPRSGSSVGPLKSLSAIRLKKTNGPVRAKRGSTAGEMLGKGKWARGRFRDDCLLSAQSGPIPKLFRCQ